jgi:arylsulfatase A-like enzyme
MLTRRQWLGGCLATGALPAKTPPNIVVFMTDQESALLPGPASLPHRARLLTRGIEFRNAFCNTPQCSPARAALLTGLEPHRAGVVTNVDGSSLGKTLRPDIPALGRVMRDAGYETGYFGKWHLSAARDDLKAYGFDHFSGAGDAECTTAAVEWMRARKQPYLAWVSVLDPHHIYDIPKKVGSVKVRAGVKPPASGLENLKGKPGQQRAFVDEDQGRQTREFGLEEWLRYRTFYLELVEKTDALLGKVLDAVSGETVIAYTSDHGDALGEHGLSYKGPFMYEELLRIPLILCGAGLKKGVRQDLVRQCDLAPTLAALAGTKWPSTVDGRDLMRDEKGPDAVFLEYYSKQKWVNPIRTMRGRRWKMNWYDSGAKELYDLQRDPGELNNLAGKVAGQREMESRINAWRLPLS